MINVMRSLNKPTNQVENCIDPQLWHACAGGMAKIPPINSKVYYFPQGHFEHANTNIDFPEISRIPPLIPCKVSSIKYLADNDTDEVYAKIQLIPLIGKNHHECGDIVGDLDESGVEFNKINDEKEKNNSFAKTLTQSDANNGGGFSVPRYCAETIFPKLDYSSEPPAQTIVAKDVHNMSLKFRHIYRGTPRRHLLTTGWSNFVNRKKLVAGDSIVFLRGDHGNLYVGIRRAKRGIGGACGWNTGDFYPRVEERGGGSVVEAARLAAGGRPFEVVYHPRAGTPEFVVGVSDVRRAMRVRWSSGMRFKMAFETEDSSRISWFMGTIASVGVEDHFRWPNSPWRLLQVVWDEPDLLQNVTRVNPWLVELVSNVPSFHLSSPFSPPRKRPRLPQPSELPFSPISPLCCLPDSIFPGVQGARHAQIESYPSDHFKIDKLHPFDFKLLDRAVETPVFVLFGKPILTADQISRSFSTDMDGYSSSDANRENAAGGSNGSGSLSAVVQKFSTEANSADSIHFNCTVV